MNAGIEDWLSTTLGAVVVPEKGREVPAHDSDLPFIGMEHVESNTGRITSFGNSGKIRSASPVVVQGDVLYGRLRPYLNKVTIAPSHAYTSGEFIVFRGNAQIDARFLRWRLTAQDFVDFACTLNTGDRPRVKWPQMADFSLLLPPMDEQRRIVDIVEDHLSRLDAAKMLTQQSRLRLATWRRAVVDSAFWHSDLIPEAKGDELIENLMRSRESRWPQSPSGKQYKSPVAADLEIFRETQPWPVVSLRPPQVVVR
jgi:type I restriction enzyme S subunit